MKDQLLAIIVCPICHSKLSIDIKETKLICNIDNVSFPIKQGIPVLLKEKDSTIVGS